MLRDKTLFVVGAGASYEFKFPTGNQLLADLQKLTNFNRDGIGRVVGDPLMWSAAQRYGKEAGISEETLLRLIQELHVYLGGAVNSIDQLIHTHGNKPHFTAVAKLAIAKVIQFREFKSPLKLDEGKSYINSPLAHDNWLHVLSKLHFRGFDLGNLETIFDNLAFLTFNYDRCIEHGIRRSLANYFGLTDQETVSLCENLTVLHPYGSLGKLPNHSQRDSFSFGRDPDAGLLLQMSKRIGTFTEGNNDPIFRKRTEELLESARNVVFLGFGYLQQNMALIGKVKRTVPHMRVYGTALDMTEPNVESVRSTLARQFNVAATLHLMDKLPASKLLTHFEFALFD